MPTINFTIQPVTDGTQAIPQGSSFSGNVSVDLTDEFLNPITTVEGPGPNFVFPDMPAGNYRIMAYPLDTEGARFPLPWPTPIIDMQFRHELRVAVPNKAIITSIADVPPAP